MIAAPFFFSFNNVTYSRKKQTLLLRLQKPPPKKRVICDQWKCDAPSLPAPHLIRTRANELQVCKHPPRQNLLGCALFSKRPVQRMLASPSGGGGCPLHSSRSSRTIESGDHNPLSRHTSAQMRFLRCSRIKIQPGPTASRAHFLFRRPVQDNCLRHERQRDITYPRFHFCHCGPQIGWRNCLLGESPLEPYLAKPRLIPFRLFARRI